MKKGCLKESKRGRSGDTERQKAGKKEAETAVLTELLPFRGLTERNLMLSLENETLPQTVS